MASSPSRQWRDRRGLVAFVMLCDRDRLISAIRQAFGMFLGLSDRNRMPAHARMR